ncbi:Rqc2 family fibronectin-binding protein [Butyrivibrio sp. WCE2006]|uniref:Rqc2 family fibronectin-binding protein n=1 Tax=Butyrivibrio sp. WCE2006 TaxID=1410611 RepID=UPI0005D1878C|nr:NFACT RNA binding domain-containing protein [Butyrivibrio sp. WCE2006]
MAFDGITVANIVRDLKKELLGGRIYKIAQTEKDELLITVRRAVENGGGQRRLFMSSDASLPLVYMTDENKQSPMVAPNFCMLLRKHIQNGKIINVEQPGLERIIRIEVEHLDEMGDLRHKILLMELMGKYSNIIFVDEDNRIIDAIKHIPSSVSSVREVLPGRDYFVPMTQDKLDPLEASRDDFLSVVPTKGQAVFKALYGSFTGLSPIISQEICYRADIDADKSAIALDADELNRLWNAFGGMVNSIKAGDFSPELVYVNDKPKEYASLPLTMYHGSETASYREYEEISALLLDFYSEKNTITRIRQKSSDLRKLVATALERNIRTLDLQTNQLKDTEKKDKYRIYGELLTVYGYSAEADAKSITVNDYNTGKDVTIPLDNTHTIAQNAKKYFDRYTKLKRTAEALNSQMQEVSQTVSHLESIAASLDIARQEEDLTDIRRELVEGGYIKGSAADRINGKGKGQKSNRNQKTKSKPFHYISSDGFHIYVGKNNYQNDELTFKMANGGDWWFHAKGIPGSHVVLITEGKEVPDRTFEEAASLAAYYSKGKDQDKVEIDYLKRKDVKKPGGAKPGFVVYYTNYSMVISTDISGLKEVE